MRWALCSQVPSRGVDAPQGNAEGINRTWRWRKVSGLAMQSTGTRRGEQRTLERDGRDHEGREQGDVLVDRARVQVDEEHDLQRRLRQDLEAARAGDQVGDGRRLAALPGSRLEELRVGGPHSLKDLRGPRPAGAPSA